MIYVLFVPAFSVKRRCNDTSDPKTLWTQDTLASVLKCLGHFSTSNTSYTELSRKQ